MDDLGYLAKVVTMEIRLGQIAESVAAKLTTATNLAWKAKAERQADRFIIGLDCGVYRADIRGSIAMVYAEMSVDDIATILWPHVIVICMGGEASASGPIPTGNAT